MPIKPKTHKPFGCNKFNRGSDGKFSGLYTLPRWRKIRANQLRIEPLCRICKLNGIDTPATICDHIEPHRGDMYKFWNGQFQSLCKRCHDSEKQRLEKSGKVQMNIGVDGYPAGTRGGI